MVRDHKPALRRRRALAVLPLLALGMPHGSAAAQNNRAIGQVSVTQAAPIPLASHPQAQAMMQQAVNNLALDVQFRFLDKTYENDVHVRDPITGKKVRVSCVRFRATSGFAFHMQPPQFTLTGEGLTIEQRIPRIEQNGLTFKWQLGPCVAAAAAFGFKLSDVKFTYRARPTLKFDDQGACTLSWNPQPESMHISIGDLNILGVQNDLDKLAKDAVREAANVFLDGFIGTALRGSLARVSVATCGGNRRPGGGVR